MGVYALAAVVRILFHFILLTIWAYYNIFQQMLKTSTCNWITLYGDFENILKRGHILYADFPLYIAWEKYSLKWCKRLQLAMGVMFVIIYYTQTMWSTTCPILNIQYNRKGKAIRPYLSAQMQDEQLISWHTHRYTRTSGGSHINYVLPLPLYYAEEFNLVLEMNSLDMSIWETKIDGSTAYILRNDKISFNEQERKISEHDNHIYTNAKNIHMETENRYARWSMSSRPNEKKRLPVRNQTSYTRVTPRSATNANDALTH